MLNLNVRNETSRIRTVVLGTALRNGPVPKASDCYDPKSRIHVEQGTYPTEQDMVSEMEAVVRVFEHYDVRVLRPQEMDNYNQIFSRDIAFVIDDKLIKANILPDRDKEFQALVPILKQISEEHIITLPENCHIEGGDVILYNDYVFIGVYTAEDYPNYITARTNHAAVSALKNLFPHKKIKAFELKKSNTNPLENALHLDCCFQPIGKHKALLHKNGFLNSSDYEFLVDLFGENNIFETTKEEMAMMFCNVFSIDDNVIISEQNFQRLNNWLRANDFIVEEVPYAEISKQGGLLRCSTLPLFRE
jgi:N-dimethylarginine dimethylaminohydrolase